MQTKPKTIRMAYYRDTGWSKKWPSRKQLGPSPSGKFIVYELFNCCDLFTREDIALRMILIVPPSEQFRLDFYTRHQWGLQ